MLTINTNTRSDADSREFLSKKGMIPAVFYGPKQKSTSIALSITEFKKVWHSAGESTVIYLKDGSESHEALIHQVDLDPVTGSPKHVDFYIIEKGKKVQVSVPLVFEGVSPAIKDLGGILVKVLHELKIEAMPKDLPHELKVDISTLVDFSSNILASSIVLPAGVTLLENPDEVVAAVSKVKEEVVEESTPVDMSTIEVVKKGKEAKEGAEGVAGESSEKSDK